MRPATQVLAVTLALAACHRGVLRDPGRLSPDAAEALDDASPSPAETRDALPGPPGEVAVTADAAPTDLAIPSEGDGARSDGLLLPGRPPSSALVVFYTPHGTLLDQWGATGEGDSFQLQSLLEPLTKWKRKLIVVRGVNNLLTASRLASVYESGPALLLTGSALPSGTGSPYQGAAPSLDVLVGQVLRSPIPSLQLGVMAQGMTALGVSWADRGAPALPDNDAELLCKTLQRPGCGGAVGLDLFSLENLIPFAKLQIDNVVGALSAGATRSISVSVLDVRSQATLSALGVDPPTYQEIAERSGTTGGRATMVKMQLWFATIFASLLDGLDGTPHPDGGTLLDHTIVLWISETGEASSGSGQSIPIVLAGNVGGQLRTGRVVEAGTSHVALLRTIQYVLTGKMDIGDSSVLHGSPSLIAELLTAPP